MKHWLSPLAIVLLVLQWSALTSLAQEAPTQEHMPDAEQATLATQAQTTEQLIVFVADQPAGESAVADAFREQTLPKVHALAESMGVEVVVVDVSQGKTPSGVNLTPLMVYQNHQGRFPYLGRFNTLNRLKNHIRTARFGGAAQEIMTPNTGMPQMQLGQAVVGLPIKITALAGHPPSALDHSVFEQSARQSIVLPLVGKHVLIHKKLVPSDRLFYCDFYPYLAEDGTLYVSTALFSQFHCHEPVFVSSEPVSGPFAEAEKVFAAAAQKLHEQVLREIDNPENGDGFVFLPRDTKRVTYEDLGLPLPPKPARVAVDPADLKLAQEWSVDETALNDNPMVQFRFPDPIVGYAGEAQVLHGAIALGENLTLASATGSFTVPVESLTMGEADLDSHLRSGILGAADHPESTFKLQKIETQVAALAFGQVIPAVLVGEFTLRGITVPLSVPSSIEAYVGEEGQPRLLIQGVWGLQLDDPFGITDQPPGPKDAATRLAFRCHIVMQPKPE